MDTKRFDSLTRAMATGKSRREVLKLIAGGAAAGALTTAVLDDATAACHGVPCSDAAPCCSGTTCQGGTCQPMSAPAPTAAPQTTAAGGTTSQGATVTDVGNNGIGPGSRDSSGAWAGIARASGAALLASKVLRREKKEAEDTI